MSFRSVIAKHSPEILTGIGVGGLFTGIFMAISATPVAMKKIENKKKELKKDKLTVIETVKTAGPTYIPTAIVAVTTAVAIVSSNKISMERNAVLATSLILSERMREEFAEKAKEVIGEKKVQEIHDEIARDRLEKNPVSTSNVIVTGKGKTLIYDELTDGYFEFDIDMLRKLELDMREDILNYNRVSVNEWLQRTGRKGILMGDDLVWDTDTSFELRFSSMLADDGRPCLVIGYLSTPRGLRIQESNCI